MYERKIPVTTDCALEMTREVLFGKWKIHLIFYISKGFIRPGQLQKKIAETSRRVLNIQLNELEEHGIVSKKVYDQLPPKVEYSLTEIGIGLLPVIDSIGKWADHNFEHLQQVIIKSPKFPVEEVKLERRAV